MIDTYQTESYALTTDTEIREFCEDRTFDVPCPEGVRTSFESTEAGKGSDNPSNPNNLTETQLNRAIAFDFRDTACFTLTYDHYCPPEQGPNPTGFCRSYTGGNFLFSGDAPRIKEEGECRTSPPTVAPPTEAPVAPPTEAPEPPTDAPVPAPTDAPVPEPTEAPVPAPTPAQGPTCEEDVKIVNTVGVTEVDVAQAVTVLSQDSTTVTVRLKNAWSYADNNIDSIFYRWSDSDFDEKCEQVDDVPAGETYTDVTLTCYHTKKFATLDIFVTDGDALTPLDDATIPKCCSGDAFTNPVVKYTLAINCETACTDAVQRVRALRGAAA